ncbi:hypothetical protein GOP47_0008613 [Adiantum capillus-veneris]|uniref:ubiquitinyl hydrolase 1 n=1 Tax=Adiantum capillus-veneris TaxID=13818 RepID=A0A9D4UZN1_ADICA|nr:hypothetical protein GOP47_0008613 [Adiantum capillus-veneris]
MSGGGGRHKNKRQRNAAEDPQTFILRQIDERNEVSNEDIWELYGVNRPPCEGCRVNNKDSPNCFCALIPLGGSRKTGILWQKDSDLEAAMGPDPHEILRPSMSSPSGLTNLGATCYVNIVLQWLFRIKPFMRGFFAAEPELFEGQAVLQKLALLFGELRHGIKRAVDSAPFAAVLQLNNSIQQDGQEFFKLLLSSLEGFLGLSKHASVRTIVQDVFRGTLSHITRCSSCGQDSSGSQKVVDFYELELNVKDLASLRESLNNYLSVEHMVGENQYICEFCKTLVDATRCTKLRSLPPVLIFQLKRIVFDAKTASMKKVTSKFSFPLVLDMSSRLSIDGTSASHIEGTLMYDLSCILLHKGSATNRGHFIANIKDDANGEWWQFDDESVSSLGFHPMGDAPVKAPTNEGPKDVRAGKAVDLEESSDKAAGDNTIASNGETHEEAHDQPENSLTSADAYMLIYSVREPHVAALASTRDEPFQLPEDLRHIIDVQNKELQEKCQEYKLNKDKTFSARADRKKGIKTLLAQMPVESHINHYFWISTSWLRTWADELDPPPIDNSNLLCEHGKVHPSSVTAMKRISEKAWNSLQSQYRGGPQLSADDCCIECVMENAKNVASVRSFKSERARIMQLLENANASTGAGKFYFVSRAWLQNWLRRKAAEAPTEIDASPTASITCPHKGLLPENYPGAKRQAVPEEAWNYFLHVAQQVHKGVDEGYISFSIETPTCSICDAKLVESASQQQDLRATKLEERQKHETLFGGGSIALVSGPAYYLVPTVWLHHWRSYLGGIGKKSHKSEEPFWLQESLRELVCEKHKGLLFRPPNLQRNRRGELIQSNPNDDIFTVVQEEDWLDLCPRWNADFSHSIQALVMEPTKQEGTTTGSEEIEKSELVQDDSCAPFLLTKPEVCHVCIEERESTELIQKLQYVDEEIYVDIVEGNEPPKALLEPVKGERRVSKRARRGPTSNKRIALKVSGVTTVYQLKLMIWEASSIVKENQRLHFCKNELIDEGATMSDLNILPGAHLWVLDTGLHENRDIAEELYVQDTDTASLEGGFEGTLLSGLPGVVGPSFANVSDVPLSVPSLAISSDSPRRCCNDGESTQDGNDLKERSCDGTM